MSTIVFLSQSIPEKHLISEEVYKYHPSSDMKEQILADAFKNLPPYNPEDYIIDLSIKISLKRYDTQNT